MRGAVELIGLAALSAALLAALGLNAVGVIAMLAFTAVTAAAWRRADLLDRPLGWANRVTVLRGHLAAILLGSLTGSYAPWTTAAVAIAAVASDIADGWLARRFAQASEFGARLDMETDAALILVLCVVLIAQGRGHASLLIVGLARYAFIGAGLLVSALRAPLVASERRRVAAAAVMALLVVALLPGIAVPHALLAGMAATAITIASFAIDIAWLLRRGRRV